LGAFFIPLCEPSVNQKTYQRFFQPNTFLLLPYLMLLKQGGVWGYHRHLFILIADI